MGDMADYHTEEGLNAWILHITGQCGPDRCQYCENIPLSAIEEEQNGSN